MNYDQARATLHHARTKKLLPKKKIANETWLHNIISMNSASGSGDFVSLVLFDKHILTWYPNGSITLDNCGYWSWSTKDRYNKYLPSGFRIWQDSPFWYIKTPRGVLPFHNQMHLTADGGDHSRPDEMNRLSAPELRHQIYKYAQLYANRLVNGIISSDRTVDCEACREHAGEDGSASAHKLHLLQHVQSETTPKSLVIDALHSSETGARCFQRSDNKMTREFLHQVIYASWHENQLIWRKPKSHKALIARTEAIMTSDDLPRLDIIPRTWLINLRMLIEDFILETLHFQRMQE